MAWRTVKNELPPRIHALSLEPPGTFITFSCGLGEAWERRGQGSYEKFRRGKRDGRKLSRGAREAHLEFNGDV
jgi:hypothetical protein